MDDATTRLFELARELGGDARLDTFPGGHVALAVRIADPMDDEVMRFVSVGFPTLDELPGQAKLVAQLLTAFASLDEPRSVSQLRVVAEPSADAGGEDRLNRVVAARCDECGGSVLFEADAGSETDVLCPVCAARSSRALRLSVALCLTMAKSRLDAIEFAPGDQDAAGVAGDDEEQDPP
jgi:hypothetical protein